ncbi:MAG: choice-of-anchor J domain-containing protein [Bacteroidales bacterium]|nr:choice-of-anchor J domain-containing protein [Bacteroidales bacterium]
MKKQLLCLGMGVLFITTITVGQTHRQLREKGIQHAEITKAAVNQHYQQQPFVINTHTDGSKAVLYSNGSFVTHPGGGPNGSNFSFLDTLLGLGSYGFGHSISNNYSVAEDFAVPAGGWTIDSLAFYCYQTNSGTTSTINNYRVQIWNGVPGATGSTVVWGNMTTNVLSRTHFSGCYRGDNLTSTARPIMRNVINTPGLTLQPGVYWVQWQAGGTLTSGPWAVPVTIQGVAITGNARQHNGTAWNNLVDGGSPQGLPFEIYGTGTPSCIHPLNPTVSNISNQGATISWSSIGGATAWVVEYGPNGFTPGTGTIVNTTTNSVNLTSLTASTSYAVYIYTNCGAGAVSAPAVVTFTTMSCSVSSQCAYVFEFVDDYGDGWNGASISVMVGGNLMGNYTLNNGANGTTNVMLCPGDNVSLVFNGGQYNDECGFTLKDPFGATLYSFTPGNNPTPGSTFYTFVANCTPPSCMTPSGLAVSNITTNSAQLSWTPGGSETAWNIQYGPAGFTIGTGTIVNVTSNPYTLTGLTQGMTYDWYIQADCGGGNTSYWTSTPNQFTVLCDAVNTYPYVESFEGTNFPPNCWFNIDADGDGKKWEVRNASQGWGIYDGTKCAVSASWVQQPLTPNNYLITPRFTINNSNMILKFYAAPQDPAYPSDKFGVEVSTTGTQPSNFTSIYTYTLTAADTVWKEITLPLSSYNGQNIYIAFRHYDCTDWFYMKIDKVQVMQSTDVDVSQINSPIFVYPNPASSKLMVANEKASRIEIYNLKGQLVAEFNDTYEANISNLAQGTYMVRVATNNYVITQKINIAR